MEINPYRLFNCPLAPDGKAVGVILFNVIRIWFEEQNDEVDKRTYAKETYCEYV